MRNFIVILFLVIASTQIRAAGSYTDLFHIGKIGTTANSVLEIGDSAEFRYNFSTGVMQVSNDGVAYFDIIQRLLPDIDKGEILSGASGASYTILPINTNGKFLSLDSAKVTGLEWLDIPAGTPTLAKGGLITNNGANDVALPVGTNAFVLTADSAQANGVKWAVSPASDHTLSSTDVLENKTLDNSNIINSTKFGAIGLELTDDVTQGLGSRASLLDFHAIGSVDYNARIIRGAGTNAVFDIVNTGSSALRFLVGATSTEFYRNGTYNGGFLGTGFWDIQPQNSIGSGGLVALRKSSVNTKDAFMDNTSDEWRIHNSVNEWLTIDLNNGATFIHHTSGANNNVPHSCTFTTAQAFSTTAGSMNCPANTYMFGPSCSGANFSTIIRLEQLSTNNFQCSVSSGPTTINMHAMCCIY